MHGMSKQKTSVVCLVAALALLTGCSSPSAHVGVGVPVGPVQVGVGVGTGGVSAGATVGHGPVGVGVGVNQRGQVRGGVGVGTSTSAGKARVGVGVGTSGVLYDPQTPRGQVAPGQRASDASGTPAAAPLRWRDAQGRIVSECQAFGNCTER